MDHGRPGNRRHSLARVVTVAALLALPIGVAGCGDDASDEERSLEVGYSYGFDIGDTSDRVAFDRMTEETGIELDFAEMGGGQEAIAALVRGDIDMAKVTFWDALNAIGQGADIRMILTVNPHFDILLAGRPEIQRLSDLRGGLILSEGPPPTTNEVYLRRALEGAGLEEGDYESQFTPDSQDRLAGLESGRGDAALLERVDLELTRDELELNRLVDIGIQVPGPHNMFAVTTEFAEQNQELLEDAVRGMLVGFEDLYGPDGREAWVAKGREEDLAEEPEEVAVRIYEGHRELEYWPQGGPPTEAEHQEAAGALAAAGIVERPVPFDEAWDTSFWRDAAGG
jgi:ABC-type nitrate/sulfonate/bicarbonate transport system substrate-binding protein